MQCETGKWMRNKLNDHLIHSAIVQFCIICTVTKLTESFNIIRYDGLAFKIYDYSLNCEGVISFTGFH